MSKIINVEDLPEIDYGEDCCKRCSHYERGEDWCYMSYGKYKELVW